MKLHLTATSERGKPVTKSGNKYLCFEVVNEERKTIMLIKLIAEDGNKFEIIADVWRQVDGESKTERIVNKTIMGI